MRFRNKRRPNHEDLWNAYVFHKQTIRELVEETGHDKKTIMKYLDSYAVPLKQHHPRPIHLVVDATYFGNRKNRTGWGVILFRDAIKKENLWWKYVTHEDASAYADGRAYLEPLGYTILSVTGDGFTALPKVFSGIPFQMCHFHMKQIVVRAVTLRPKTEAGVVLLALAQTLTKTDEGIFSVRLRSFHFTYATFLSEKTIHPDGSWSWTHEGARQAYLGLTRWFPYLFTCHEDHSIPNTTNTCDGHFSHVKDIVRIHRGLSRTFKEKVLDAIFLESTIAPKLKKKRG